MAESGGSMFKKRTKFQRSRQKAKSASGKIEIDRYSCSVNVSVHLINNNMLNQLPRRLQNNFTVLYSITGI